MAKTRTAAAKTSGGKMTYYFSKNKTEGKGLSKQLLGGKGANLAEMTSIGLPVPPGFTITTECCDAYYKSGRKLPAGLMDAVRKNIGMLEKELGKKFGDDKSPLLVSVRSGAANGGSDATVPSTCARNTRSIASAFSGASNSG